MSMTDNDIINSLDTCENHKWILAECNGEYVRVSHVIDIINRQKAEIEELQKKVVEVVRCKDCQYGRPIDITKSPEKYYRDDCVVCECEDVVGEEPMIYQPDHFCRCGKRREEGGINMNCIRCGKEMINTTGGNEYCPECGRKLDEYEIGERGAKYDCKRT